MNWYNRYLLKITSALKEEDLGMLREFAGLVINIERPAGSDRYGVNKEGKEWRTRMKYDYGFISSAKGEDGEGLDVYVGPDERAEKVYVIHQVDPKTGDPDEDKCMIGFRSGAKAKKAYLEHYDSPKFFGSMTEISMSEFKDIIENSKSDKVQFKKKSKSTAIIRNG